MKITRWMVAAAATACFGLGGCDDDDQASVTDSGVLADAGTDPGRTFTIPGLSAPVTSYIDAHGFLHLDCEDDASCFAAQGYFHAAHRFFQMDLRRRVTRGQLSQMVGSVTVDVDRKNILLMSTPDGRPLIPEIWETTDAQTKAAIEAYTLGVNAWITDMRAGRNGAVMPREYAGIGIGPELVTDWSPLDSVGAAMAIVTELTNRAAVELTVGERWAALPEDTARDLLTPRPATRSAILPATTRGFPLVTPPDADALRALHRRLKMARPALAAATERLGGPQGWPVPNGSNNWAVGPTRTPDGATLVANDPHLGMSNPAFWYIIHMDSKSKGGSFKAAGASFAGLPGVAIGQNEDLAWGVTTTYFDQSDVYIETLNADGTAVMFNGEEVPLVPREISVDVLNAEPMVETIWYVPHHGPVLSIDEEAGVAISMRWTGQEVTTDLNFVLGMMTATSVESARDVLTQLTSFGQNFVVGDTAGHIGWFPYNHVPRRPWASPETPAFLPLPGDGRAEWDGYVAYEDLPQAYDPAAAFVATANNDMTGALADGDPTNDANSPAFQHFTAPGFRHQRIVARIEAGGDTHDLSTMQAIQSDVYSSVGEVVVPHVLTAVEGVALSDPTAALVAALAAWDFQCPTGLDGIDPTSDAASDPAVLASSLGCAAFHVVFESLRDGIFEDDLAPAGPYEPNKGRADGSLVVRALADPGSFWAEAGYWDNLTTEDVVETRAQTILAALDTASAWLVAEHGADPTGWQWGRMHTLTLRADLLDAAGIPMFNNGPYANDGGLYTVDVAPPHGAGDYQYSHGASMRLACHLLDTVTCTVELPGGQIDDDTSAHYEDQLKESWLSNTPVPLTFDLNAAAADATETIRLQSE